MKSEISSSGGEMYDKVLGLLEKLEREEAWTVERSGEVPTIYRRAGRVFLVVREASDPLRLDVGVGRELARLLADKYESVAPSRVMDRATWVEVICSGQLEEDEVLDLIRASWERVGAGG
jgi:predicted DNA-binding protein (MmcQ/YjbR family)